MQKKPNKVPEAVTASQNLTTHAQIKLKVTAGLDLSLPALPSRSREGEGMVKARRLSVKAGVTVSEGVTVHYKTFGQPETIR